MALPRWHAAALSAISFGSGAAGLAFEMVWLHRMGLVFGNSVWAAALVLSSFMAGLGLGSLAVARTAARIRRPLRVYAAAETTVALTGIALIFALPHVNTSLRPLFETAARFGAVNGIRLVAAFLLLLVPTTAMGATLPLLVAATPAGAQHTGRSFGRIYGWNTLGAVAGVLIAEIVLVDRVGVAGTACVAGAPRFRRCPPGGGVAHRRHERHDQHCLPRPLHRCLRRLDGRCSVLFCRAGCFWRSKFSGSGASGCTCSARRWRRASCSPSCSPGSGSVDCTRRACWRRARHGPKTLLHDRGPQRRVGDVVVPGVPVPGRRVRKSATRRDCLVRGDPDRADGFPVGLFSHPARGPRRPRVDRAGASSRRARPRQHDRCGAGAATRGVRPAARAWDGALAGVDRGRSMQPSLQDWR